MKKICHVFFDEYPKDSRIRRYCNALLENNYHVYVVALKTAGLPYIEKSGNLKIYRIPLQKKRGSFSRRLFEYGLFQIFSTIYVSYITIRYFPRYYQVHTLPDFLVFSCILPKILGSKIILDFHELFPEFMMQHNPSLNYNSLFIKIILWQEKLSFHFASEIIVFHDPAKDILQNRINSSKIITTVMNGVDASELPCFNKNNSEIFRLIYNGTINYNLNLSLLVKALCVLKVKKPDVNNRIGFYMYGDGPDLQNILELARGLKIENVHYKGRLPFLEMMKELETAGACVLPPKKDIYSDLYYSLKLTEMIYYKIPVIATRLDTYVHYYPENCLIYFNSEDEEDLAEKISFVYQNQNELSTYTDNAFREYQKYNWEIMKERYLSLLNN